MLDVWAAWKQNDINCTIAQNSRAPKSRQYKFAHSCHASRTQPESYTHT